MTKTKKTFVTDEAFVKAWLKGGTTADVAARLDREVNAVYQRSHRLRKLGVNLPVLERNGRGPKVVDVKALNTLIKEAK